MNSAAYTIDHTLDGLKPHPCSVIYSLSDGWEPVRWSQPRKVAGRVVPSGLSRYTVCGPETGLALFLFLFAIHPADL